MIFQGQRNPIYEKEQYTSERSTQRIALILIFNGIMTAIALLVFAGMIQSFSSGAPDYSRMLQLYIVLSMVEFALMLCVIPAAAGGGISTEREHRTLEAILSTGVSPWKIVFGKIHSCMDYILLLALSSLPVICLVFVYGGVRLEDVAGMIVCMIYLGCCVTCICIMYSSCSRKTALAIFLSYGMLILLIGGSFFLHYAAAIIYPKEEIQLNAAVSWYHYGLLLNPVFTFYGLMNEQAGNHNMLFEMINYEGRYTSNWVTDNWIAVSLAAQGILAMLHLVIARIVIGWESWKK